MNINYSNDFDLNSSLFKRIKTVHDLDVAGSGSVLEQFLNEQAIDLDDDETEVLAADDADTLAKQLHKDAENEQEKWEIILTKYFKQHRNLVQFLKGLKRGKVHELGDWGVTVNGENRIEYPPDFPGLVECFRAFIAKHNTFPPALSPLKPYLDEHSEINLVQTLADLTTAETHYANAGQKRLDAEEQFELRDTKFEPVMEHIRGMGQFLINLYSENPRHLGRWGFEVNEASRKEIERNIKVPQSGTKTVYKAVQNSLVRNNSPFSVEVYSGKTTDGTPITLGPNEVMTIKFRFGTFTVKNNNTTDSADISATTYDN